MRKSVITILFSVSLYCTNASAQDNRYTPKYSAVLDISSGKNMMKQCSRPVPKNITTFWKPDSDHITYLFDNFKKILALQAEGCCIAYAKVKKLDSVAFQFVGVKINGRKYIYINAFGLESEDDFNRMFKDWQQRPVIVCDGGDWFWGVLFDVQTGEFSQLAFNGVG